MTHRAALLILALLAGPPGVAAQTPFGDDQLTALADSILAAFGRRDTAAFDRLMPSPAAQTLLRDALHDSVATEPVAAGVLHRGDRSALVLLAGYPRYGNSGDETVSARDFSGLYPAERTPSGAWHLGQRLALGAQARIVSHHLEVALHPGVGVDVTDTLRLTVLDSNGLGLRLNRRAAIAAVQVDGRTLPWRFGGGLLWIDAPRSTASRVVIRYTLHVADDSLEHPNSGSFHARYGHVRNQHFWHPFIWFNDAAQFRITVRAPEAARVATDLEQAERVVDGFRVITAMTSHPTAALSLFYDLDWVPVRRAVGRFTFEVFATPDFSPSPDTLAQAFERTVQLLSARFGPPPGGYRAVVQERARGQGTAGWPFMSNAVIAAAWNGWVLIRSDPPRAIFGHEVAHAWTTPSGPARNFLSEGWATWAESVLLRDAMGPDIVPKFWASEGDNYRNGGFEGHVGLADDPHNSGIAYSKGSWVLHMLEEEIGAPAFDTGMRAYMAIPSDQSSDYPAFRKAMSQAAGRDLTPFLDPWVLDSVTPRIQARLDGDRLVVRQAQPRPFMLSVEVGIATVRDTSFTTVRLTGAAASVPLDHPAPAGATLLVDPHHRLLLMERQGQP